jgi:hypothetical protein
VKGRSWFADPTQPNQNGLCGDLYTSKVYDDLVEVHEILPTDILISRDLFEKVKAALKRTCTGDLGDPAIANVDFLFKIIKDHRKHARDALAAIKESEGK